MAVSSALWMTATSANPIGIQIAQQFGLEIGFGSWLVAASVPALTSILLLPRVVAWFYPPGVGATPEAPAAARKALAALGRLSRDERITAVAFVMMVSGWIFADRLGLNVTSIAFGGLGLLRRRRLSHPGRALPARVADDAVLPRRVPCRRHGVDPADHGVSGAGRQSTVRHSPPSAAPARFPRFEAGGMWMSVDDPPPSRLMAGLKGTAPFFG